jgi:hypothetical protein
MYNKNVGHILNQVGPPVRGSNCFGRERFVDLLWKKLSGGHILLAAPRRFGKTSIMYKMLDEPRWEYQMFLTDLEPLREPADLVAKITELLMAKAKTAPLLRGASFLPNRLWSGFRQTVEEIELHKLRIKLRDELRPHWQASGDELFHRLSGAGFTIAFLLDEFPMMLDGMMRRGGSEDARLLLRWMRSVRQKPDSKDIRFLIGGSVGIGAILRKLGEISSINDFESIRLETFSTATAAAFLDSLAQGTETTLSRPCRKKMLDMVGLPIPYFLQVLFSEVRKVELQNGCEVTPKLVEQVYHQRVLGVECKTYFDHYYGRIPEYYGLDRERAIKRMLRTLAMSAEVRRDVCYQVYRKECGASANAEQFNDLAADLENDFYIRPSEDGLSYSFASKILRDWWLRYYGMEYGD